MLHEASQYYGELTAAYGQSEAKGHNVEFSSFREIDADFQTSRNSNFRVHQEP